MKKNSRTKYTVIQWSDVLWTTVKATIQFTEQRINRKILMWHFLHPIYFYLDYFDTFFSTWQQIDKIVLFSRESTSGHSGLWEFMFQSYHLELISLGPEIFEIVTVVNKFHHAEKKHIRNFHLFFPFPLYTYLCFFKSLTLGFIFCFCLLHRAPIRK